MFKILLPLVLAIATLDDAQAPLDPPRSPAAVSAQQHHDAAVKKAKDAYNQALLSADRHMVDDLDGALHTAMANGNVEEVTRIDTAKKAAQEKVKEDLREAEGTALAGKIFFVLRGEPTVYLNGQPLAFPDGSSQMPISLAKGDLLVVRARSRFVYRAFVIGFLPDGGKPSALTGVKLLGDVSPQQVTTSLVYQSPPAPKGHSDGSFERASQDAGFTDMPVLGLPDVNKWYTFAAVVN